MKRLNYLVTNFLLISTIVLFSLHTEARAEETALGLLKKGAAAMQEGKFPDAVTAFQDAIKKYPKDLNIPNIRYLLGIAYYSVGNYAEAAKSLSNSTDFPADTKELAAFHLGASYYFLGESTKALTTLEPVSKSTNKELSPLALLFQARANMDIGNKLLAKDKVGATKAFEAGILKINELFTKFPQDSNLADALMIKSNISAQAGKFDAAAASLEELKNRPDGAEMSADADYLLGYVFSQQAQVLKSEFKKEEAAAVIQKARETYQRLLKSDSLVVANDAAFQLANLSFADEDFDQALKEFRSLRTKDELIESQDKRIAELRDRLAKAAANKELFTSLQRSLQREEGKLKALKDNDDSSKDSLIRVADCYIQLKKYDEGRSIYRHVMKFSEGTQLKELTLKVIVSQALQGLSAKAEAGYADFKSKFPNDPLADAVPYFIARAMIQQGRFDEAILKLRTIIKDMPNSRFAALSVQELARALLGQKKPEEALKEIDQFSAKAKSGKFKLPPDAFEDAERFRGYTLFQLGKKEEAIKVMKDLSLIAKNEALKDEVSYQVGNMLNNTGKSEDAILAMQDFLKKFPSSINVGKAMIVIAGSHEKLKKIDEAILAYRDIVNKVDDPALKIFSLEKIWRLHLAGERFEEMIKVQDELITTFPKSARSLVAQSERIKYLERAKKPDEAEALQQDFVTRFTAMSPTEKSSEFGQTLASYVVRIYLRQADNDYKSAIKMGAIAGLNEVKKTQWKNLLDSASKTLDKAITEFPSTNLFSSILKNKVDVMLLLIRGNSMEQSAAFTYLSELAGIQKDEVVKAQVLIARANLAYQLGQKTIAARFYKEALAQISTPQLIAWQEYDQYGSILLENKEWDEAVLQFGVLRESFPKSDQAQAAATYGLGAAYLGKGDTAKATLFFIELKEKYPKSDKLLEVDFAQAMLGIAAGKYDESFATLKKIMNSPSASNQTRAQSLLEFGKALELIGDKKGKTKETFQGEGKPELNIFDLAAGYYLKITLLYPSQTEICAESLYHLVEIKVKQGKKEDARKHATDLSTKFPASKWVEKVTALGL